MSSRVVDTGAGKKATMCFADPEGSYILTDEDTGRQLHMSGYGLRTEGLTLVLSHPKGSAVWHVVRK